MIVRNFMTGVMKQLENLINKNNKGALIMTNLKEIILKQLNYCSTIADDIIKHNASRDILNYTKKWAEIESPMTNETDCMWIRICWGDIYIFLYIDEYKYQWGEICLTGKISYQLDGLGEYGGELIDVSTKEIFKEQLNNLSDFEILDHSYMESENGDYSEYEPKKYIEFNKI